MKTPRQSAQTKNTFGSKPVRLGFVPLNDCAPIVMAHELGLFAKHGVKVELSREVGWATVRDKVVYGELEAAHAPAGMVVAASAGLDSIRVECLTGIVINLHGNAITLSQRLWQKGVRDGPSLRKEIESQRGKSQLTFGIVFPFSSHKFLLHSWLRFHGIDPIRDVRIAVVPPPQMVGNLKAGHLDGYCVGEPWNSVAVRAKVGFVVATSSQLAPRHPEKVMMVKASFAEEREPEHLAMIAALVEACGFCEQPENREQVMKLLADKRYLNVSLPALQMSMGEKFDLGNGRVEQDPDGAGFHIFSGGGANEPNRKMARWVMDSLQVKDPKMLRGLNPEKMFNADIYRQALQLGCAV